MKKLNYILIFGISLAFFSCSNNSTEKTTNSEHSHDHDDSIILDNGEKWKVVDEMLAHIRNMEADIVSFSGNEQKNYASLAVKLEDNIALLTSNCTMKGKAHDELHKWLLTYINLVDDLSNSADDEEASKHYSELQESFRTFNTYFK